MTTHIPSLGRYVAVFAALLALTATTTAVAYVYLGRFNLIIALTIAGSKALLVVFFFMHLVETRHRTQLVAGAGILWLVTLIAFTLSDELTRNWISQPVGW